MQILCFLALIVALPVIFCQVPLPCTSPRLWEARYFEYDNSKNEHTYARLSYDAIRQRERVIEEYVLGSADNFYDILYLHSEKIQYVYDLKAKTCQKQTIDRPWRDFGIPKNATSYGESYIGSSAVEDANLLVTLWGTTFTDDKGNKIDYSGVWTYEACLPVNIIYSSDTLSLHRHVAFFDITLGIDNPAVFEPRKECLGL